MGAPFGEEPATHTFIAVSNILKDGTIFFEYLPEFKDASKRYQIVAKFKIDDGQCYRRAPKRFITEKRITMYDLLRIEGKSEKGIAVKLYYGEYYFR